MSPSQFRHSNVCVLQVCSIFQTGLADLRHADTSWAHQTPEGGLIEAREFSSCAFTGAEISLKAMEKKRQTARSSRQAGRLIAPAFGWTGEGGNQES